MRLIDADKLDDVVIILNQKGWAITRNEYKRIDGILFEFPTVAPLKHGRWVDDYNAEEFPLFRDGWKCSACGFRTSYGKPKYCMNCGAQMDGENNET